MSSYLMNIVRVCSRLLAGIREDAVDDADVISWSISFLISE